MGFYMCYNDNNNNNNMNNNTNNNNNNGGKESRRGVFLGFPKQLIVVRSEWKNKLQLPLLSSFSIIINTIFNNNKVTSNSP